MNGFLLLLPFLAIRFGLLAARSKDAVWRAARFAPRQGGEKIAYGFYQLSNLAFFLVLLFTKVRPEGSWQAGAGAACYCLGLFLCALSVLHFASPDSTGLNTGGIYRISRNPMYIAYFVCFLGMVLLTRSPILLGILLVFQISSHWIILSEERWCAEKFGPAWQEYAKRVRRYL